MNKLNLQKAINTIPHTIVKMWQDGNVSMEYLVEFAGITNVIY